MSRHSEVEATARRGGFRQDRARDRIVVTRGGTLPDDVLAAIAVALGSSIEQEAAAAEAAAAVTGASAPAWLRAALIEGTGGPLAVAPGDLDVTDGR